MDFLFSVVFRPEASPSGQSRWFLILLLVNFAWKKLVALADSKGIFDLIHFLLPLLSTLGSTMYFRYLCLWMHATLSMSPYDRALRLSNMFIN
jgi:hypothetical protein